MVTLNKTARRLSALRFISEGAVTYSPKIARWTVRDEVISGWDYRTFTELRSTTGLLSFGKPKAGVSKVELTASGKKLLTSWLD
jgi:hypothetical protein